MRALMRAAPPGVNCPEFSPVSGPGKIVIRGAGNPAPLVSCCPPALGARRGLWLTVEAAIGLQSASEVNLKWIDNTILRFLEHNLFALSGPNLPRLRRSDLPSVLGEGEITILMHRLNGMLGTDGSSA